MTQDPPWERQREPPRLRLARLIGGRMQPYGAGKVLSMLYPYERGRRDAYQFRVRSKTGSQYGGNTADFHAHPFAVNGYSDWRNWAVALAVCRPGDRVVEVGANVGTETVGFSDIVGGRGKVVAFEPLPSNLAALQETVKGLRHPNVTLFPYALSEQAGTETFAAPPASMSQGIGHLLGPAERQAGATYEGEPVDMDLIEVSTRTLDEFSEQVRGMRLLVADAEGSELAILRGGHSVLREEQPVLVLEASQAHQRRAGHSLEELHAELSLRLNYSVHAIVDLGVREVADAATAPAHSNWLCLPSGGRALLHRVRRCLRRCGLTPCVLGLNPLTSPASR